MVYACASIHLVDLGFVMCIVVFFDLSPVGLCHSNAFDVPYCFLKRRTWLINDLSGAS